MLRYLLDTNLCVRVLRDRPAGLRLRLASLAEVCCISTIVEFELLTGAAKSARPDHNRAEIRALLARMALRGFDTAAAEHAADIREDLRRRGTPIGQYELLIAGHARSLGLIVVTGNLGEFRRVDGLRCEDWLDS